MKAKLMQGVLMAVGLALAMPLLADDGQSVVGRCDEIGQVKGDGVQDRKYDPSCVERVRAPAEDDSLPVSGDMRHNREQNRVNNPDTSVVTSPVTSPSTGGKGGR